jgi:hypothetical protein
MHRLGLFPVKVENILRSLPEYIRQGLETANDELAKTLLILLTDKVVSFVNDLDTRNTLKTILEQKANWEKVMGVSDEALTYNFIKGSYQLLIYGPLPGFIELTKKQAKNVFLVIDEEGNWNNRLDNLKNENIGFTGLAGLGMGLLLSINGPYNIKKRSMPKATSNII